MSINQLHRPQQTTNWSTPHRAALAVVALGVFLTWIGLGSFTASLVSSEPPRYFLSAGYIGMTLIFVGAAMIKFRARQRRVAGESLSVKNAENHMIENHN